MGRAATPELARTGTSAQRVEVRGRAVLLREFESCYNKTKKLVSTRPANTRARGYCGSTAEHCAAASGCQPGFGTCTGRAPRRSRNLWQESEVEQELEQE